MNSGDDDTADPAGQLGEARRHPAGDLAEVDVPAGPAAYAWWRDNTPIYIAATAELRAQLNERDLQGGLRPVPPFRKRARLLGQRAGLVPRGGAQSERITAIDRFIADCAVSWVPTGTLDAAQQLASAAAEVLLDGDHQPDEDELLQTYLAGLPATGRVYPEVPIGAPPGGAPRRIDAVRFPALPNETVWPFDEARFRDDLPSGQFELIEVKRHLNRPVFGQLLIARELAIDEWGLPPDVQLAAVALVGSSDRVLEPIFARHELQVITVT